MKVLAHVREKTLAIQCADGTQLVRWLANVAVHRYDDNYGIELGAPQGVRMESGELIDMEKVISDVLADNEHVWILLTGLLSLCHGARAPCIGPGWCRTDKLADHSACAWPAYR